MNKRRGCGGIVALLLGMIMANTACAQKQGGVLRVFHRDSPASMSILEEGSISVIMPMMGVFNNLVIFDQQCGKTEWSQSCPISQPDGRGARTALN
jgi:hypothetical protein